LESTPRGQTHWSTRELAKTSGLSHMTISRIWRAFGLQPHRSESFKLSPDPLLVEKVRDIVGLYMNPPEHALVFCVDEKSQIQHWIVRNPCCPCGRDNWNVARTTTSATARPRYSLPST
jgi:hypothetical protein